MTQLSISIVSHGHAKMLDGLLRQLTLSNFDLELILTVNVPEIEPADWLNKWLGHERLRIVCNTTPKGFASNHNHAAHMAKGDFLCILNPDLGLDSTQNIHERWSAVLKELVLIAASPTCGLAYPIQLNAQGDEEDFERPLITPWALMRRYLIRTSPNSDQGRIDWVCGACMLMRTEVFLSNGGFDERYHLYCEDVDLCLRLQLAGYALTKATCTVMHDSRRNTRKSMMHLIWHIGSLLRLWTSKTFWQYWRRNHLG